MAAPVPTRSTATRVHAQQDGRDCTVEQVTSSEGRVGSSPRTMRAGDYEGDGDRNGNDDDGNDGRDDDYVDDGGDAGDHDDGDDNVDIEDSDD